MVVELAAAGGLDFVILDMEHSPLELNDVGRSDLSVALGVGGSTFDHPTLGKALDTVVAATRRHGKFAMTLIGNKLDVDYGKRIAARGVQIMVLGTDVDLFVDSVTRMSGLTR